jgi:glycosyltransferase involved in cell wall biosynthesis
MAGEGDLGNSNVPMVTMDACNFISDEYFSKEPTKKVWDILYVTRAVTFKRLPLFLKTIRSIYDKGFKIRVLLICCIPPYDIDPPNLIEMYQHMFSLEERKIFTVIPLEHDYPFTLDHTSLSHFYHSSKIFTHFAEDERRCRVVGMAVASKMPVICREGSASIIPDEFKKEPYWYKVSNEEYDDVIIRAVNEYDINKDLSDASYRFNIEYTSNELKTQLSRFLEIDINDMNDKDFNFNNLDIRLGRHHQVSIGPNKVDITIDQFIDFLNSSMIHDSFDYSIPDLERYLLNMYVWDN